MNSLLESIDPLARLVLQALLNSLWQGALIVVLAWLLLRALGRVSAATRHAVWLVSLLTLAALPLASLLSQRHLPRLTNLPEAHALPTLPTLLDPRAELAEFNSPVRYFGPSQPLAAREPASATPRVNLSDKTATYAPPTECASVTPISAPSEARPSRQSFALPANPLARLFSGQLALWLSGLWLLVGALACGRLAHSYFCLFRLRRRLTLAPAAQCERLASLARVFGLKRRVGLFTAAEVKLPLTIGWLRPLIVLPEDLPATLSEADYDSVLAHELAHIKRWDYATNLLQRLAQALLFFHPAVWLIGKQLIIERELACDDWAVKLTGEPRRYASCLTKLVEVLSESKPLLAATGILFGKHIISRRIEMILNRDRNATTAVSKTALVYAIGLASVIVFVCSTLSPVIAVPLAQQRGGQPKKAQPPKPATPKAAPAAPSEPAPPVAPTAPEILAVDELAPLARIEIDGHPIAVPTPHSLAELPHALDDVLRDIEHVAPLAPLDHLTAPLAWGQSGDKSKTPTIPESELLGLLTEIVKKDSDPNVRNEALQGIYRMRSDAAINALIQLYDSVSDAKLKGEIVGYLIRRNGDNAKAIAKLVAIAKSESDPDLRGKALSQLAYVKGDEGAEHLIQIYDSLQDPKLKQRVIRSLAYNKSKKAVDKLMAIAKNDSDPTVRQAAIRSIYGIDSQLYLNFAEGNRPVLKVAPEVRKFEFDGLNGRLFELDREKIEDMQRRAREQFREAEELMRERLLDGDSKLLRKRPEQERLEKEKEKRPEPKKPPEKEQKSLDKSQKSGGGVIVI